MAKVKPVAMMGTSMQHKLDLRVTSHFELLTELLYKHNTVDKIVNACYSLPAL